MAEVVTFGVQEIVNKVASLASEEISLVWGFQGDLTKLRESLLLTEAMLRDAGQSKEVRPEAVQIWVNKLEDIAHEADDVLDECGYELLRRQVEVRNQMKKKVLNFLSLHYNPIAFRLKMGHKIKKLNAALEDLNKRAGGIGLVARSSTSHDNRAAVLNRETDPGFDQDEKYMVGRDELVSDIVKDLINSSNKRETRPCVMAIAGMAGLGKATLAKAIYQENETLRMHLLKLEEFPMELQNLINLRHIYFVKLRDMKYLVGVGRLNNLRSLSFFVVGKERGHGIKELGGLKHLKGALSIYDLEHVRDGEEAKEAKLAEKTNIRILKLIWSADEDRSSPINNNDKDVLEGLKPHSKLESLKIRNFRGETFPPWMMCGDLFSSLKRLFIKNAKNLTEWTEATTRPTERIVVFPCLEEMVLSRCPSLECIPITPKGIASLRQLEICDCDKLSSLPSGLQYCTSLERLSISYCQNLEAIPITHGLPSLRQLKISICAKLSSLPSGLQHCTSLEHLSITYCPNLEAIPSLDSLTQLRELMIYNCDGLSSLPSGLQHCTSLEHLSITYCRNLEAIPSLDSLTQLLELRIYNCDGLKSVPISACAASLTRLKELEIGGFWKEFDSFPAFQVIPQLETLTLLGWPKLKSLPEQVQHFTSLTSLKIWSFDGMEALPEWLGNLASLEELRIDYCKNLMYLPPLEAMKCLTKLSWMCIENCPLLNERCDKDSGLEWPKISHIPNICVDGWIQQVHSHF